MKKKINLFVILIFLANLATAAPEAHEPILISQYPAENPAYNIYQVIPGKQKALTKNWAFVVDTSDSILRISGRMLAAFNTVTSFPTDQLRFCAITFNGRNNHKLRDWADASELEFERANRWILRHTGVNSYAERAIKMAIEQPIKGLTVIVISDGGFTENFSRILGTIESSQQWRVDNGYSMATIVAIGIENLLSRESLPPYPKDPDHVCQARMERLGSDVWDEVWGGYYLIKRIDY